MTCETWSECKHCGERVFDLCCNVFVEWWSDNDCGCERGSD